ncbi:MAG TPA: Hsp70 family protein [Candidatus Binatia bacterium]|nr:Hsp70 family protein [Candidatus Binatia bacterium]
MTGQGYVPGGSAPPYPPVELGIPGITGAVEIGRGGFGVVYRAQRPGYDQSVAVKVLASVTLDPEAKMRFEREVRAMGALFGHPHIVGIITAGYTSADNPYIVMEDMSGGSLADALRAQGRLSWQDAVAIGFALADALEAAHAAHVLHRDVKPENVLYSRYGTPKLGDFGIASLGEGAETRSSTLLVSLPHTAPEVLEGQPRTPSSDLYAVGSTVMTLILGRPPFARGPNESAQSVFRRISADPPPDLRDLSVPDPVCRVIEKAMAKAPELRYVTAARFRTDLDEAVKQTETPGGRAAKRPAAITWRLGIDFGTTYTAAAVADDQRTTVLTLEGDGSQRVRSAVWLDDAGKLIVGEAAINQYWLAPERFEPTPKRLIGQPRVLLGETAVPVVEMVAAVLRRVVEEATRQHGGEPPSEARLTHPAGWAATRSAVLVEAARLAGLDKLKLIPEPVAAAAHVSRARRIEVDQHVAVYDFGGGTFDAAVLRRTEDGFEVAGPPGGKDPMGGEDIDRKIIDHLGEGPVGRNPDWAKLMEPPDTRWRQRQADLYAWVRRAKEALSSEMAFTLMVPGLDQSVQVTRGELEDLIRADVEETVEILRATIVAAGISAEERDLAGIFLVGGSSRMPIVAETVWRRLGRRPDTQDDPKSVVALGGAEWGSSARRDQAKPGGTVVAAPGLVGYPASPITPYGAAQPAGAPPPPASPPPGAWQDAGTYAPSGYSGAAPTGAAMPPPPAGPPPGYPSSAGPPSPGGTATVVVPPGWAAQTPAAPPGMPAWASAGTAGTGSGGGGRPSSLPPWLRGPRGLAVGAAALAVVLIIVIVLATRGSGPGTNGGALGDACLAGTWVAQDSSNVNLNIQGEQVSLSGGGGEVLTFSSSGTLTDKLTGSQPYQGTDTAGDTISIQLTGQLTYTALASSPTLTLSNPSGNETATTFENGSQVSQSAVPPSGASETYTCSGTSLTLHESGSSSGESLTGTINYTKG